MIEFFIFYTMLIFIYFTFNYYLGGNQWLNLIVAIGWPLELVLWIFGTIFVWIEDREMRKLIDEEIK